MNWVIYEDKLSGARVDRPALNLMMRHARLRQLDVVAVFKLDRLFRSLRHIVTTLAEFDELGVSFIAIRDQVDMSLASGRLQFHLIAAFSEFERELIRERVIAGVRNAQRRGVKLGRPATVNTTDVALLRARGLSLGQISRKLGISKSAAFSAVQKSREVSRCESLLEKSETSRVCATEISEHLSPDLKPVSEDQEAGPELRIPRKHNESDDQFSDKSFCVDEKVNRKNSEPY